MPLDKDMNHEDMVAELIKTYEKSGKIGATKPKNMKHALEIANAVAYNLEESQEAKKEINEMTLDEILKSMEEVISSREKALSIFELNQNPKVKVTLDSGETFETEVDPATSEDDLKKQYKVGTEINVGKSGQERKARIKSATLTKQMGESSLLESVAYEVSLCQVEDGNWSIYDSDIISTLREAKNLAKSYISGKIGSEEFWIVTIEKGTNNWGVSADDFGSGEYVYGISNKNKEITDKVLGEEVYDFDKLDTSESTKQMGESFDQLSYDMFVKDPDLYDLEMLQGMKQGFMNKRGAWTDEDIAELNAITKRMKELKATNENLDPLAIIDNPIDVISMDVPLALRLLEWSREDASEDIDLHDLIENLTAAMQDREFLTMENYEEIIPCTECVEENLDETDMGDMGTDPVLPMRRKSIKPKKVSKKPRK